MDDACVELDGCCGTHGPCFRKENESVDDGSFCEGWPCPAITPES